MQGDARTCGPCTLCCKVMSIDELAKPAGAWCSNCAVGAGCRVYGAHPPSCQAFTCQWLVEPSLPDGFRPDRVKVVLAAQEPGPCLIAHCDPATPVAWKREPIYSLLKHQARASWGTGMTVLAKAADHLWLITPSEDLDLGVVGSRSGPIVAEGRDGKVIVNLQWPDRDNLA